MWGEEIRHAIRLDHVFKANIETGAETQLTNFAFGHVDGRKGSPDGQWVYYNGSQTRHDAIVSVED